MKKSAFIKLVLVSGMAAACRSQHTGQGITAMHATPHDSDSVARASRSLLYYYDAEYAYLPRCQQWYFLNISQVVNTPKAPYYSGYVYNDRPRRRENYGYGNPTAGMHPHRGGTTTALRNNSPRINNRGISSRGGFGGASHRVAA